MLICPRSTVFERRCPVEPTRSESVDTLCFRLLTDRYEYSQLLAQNKNQCNEGRPGHCPPPVRLKLSRSHSAA